MNRLPSGGDRLDPSPLFGGRAAELAGVGHFLMQLDGVQIEPVGPDGSSIVGFGILVSFAGVYASTQLGKGKSWMADLRPP